MQRNFDKGMWAAVGLLFAFTIANALVASHNIRDLYDARVRVGQSRQVQGTLQRVLSAAADAETGVRGYVITGEAAYLEPYQAALGVSRGAATIATLADQPPLVTSTVNNDAHVELAGEDLFQRIPKFVRTVCG